LETLDVNDIIAESLRGEQFHWRDIIFVSQPEQHKSTISRNRGQCTFKINFQRILSCGFTLNEQVLTDSELGYWLKNTEDGVLVLKLFNSRAHILFGKLKQVIALEVSCQGAPCFVLSAYRDSKAQWLHTCQTQAFHLNTVEEEERSIVGAMKWC